MAKITAEQVLSEIDPLWRLHDTLTLHQAAALIAGIDPNKIRGFNSEVQSKILGLKEG